MYNMRIEHHINKEKRLLNTSKKLDYEDDYETLIENYLLSAAHLINATLHKLKILNQDKDIKHNQLYGFLLKEKSWVQSEEVVSLIQQLEQLRPSHVYGKGENGETARIAEEIFNKIKKICDEILKNER